MTRINGTDLFFSVMRVTNRSLLKLLSPTRPWDSEPVTVLYKKRQQQHTLLFTTKYNNMATTHHPHYERPFSGPNTYTNFFDDPKVFIFQGYHDLVYGIEGSRLVSSTSCFTGYHR